ncbi:hypothetical protein SOPP22_15930 [Shewanella sp. OPT22]|nr:hypothetical protein SOPP22_15930 [Shewanella sp. OPT22]
MIFKFNYIFLSLSILLLSSCSVEEQLDPNKEFERLYIALKMPEIMDSLEQIEVNDVTEFSEQLNSLPPEVRSLLLAAVGSDQIINEKINRKAVKLIFKARILEQLRAYEISKAADFYSSEAGLKAHRAIIEGEKSINDYFDSQ